MNILDDFKNAWKRNNAVEQLIIINVIVFVFLGVLLVFSSLFGFEPVFNFVYRQFSIPAPLPEFITRPWTLVTYGFAHSLTGILHILFNMLFLYWFGRLVVEYLGNQKLYNLYILGVLAGGLVYLLAYNTIQFYIDRSGLFSGMVGASAAVYAVSVAAATLLPEHRFFLIFLGPVKIKYIVAFYIFLSFLGSVGDNAGGNLAHLGGALIGFIYVKQLQKGNDIGRFITLTMEFFSSMFKPKSNIKVSYKNKKTTRSTSRSTTSRPSKGNSSINQDEIDKILDKISEKGYESLSKEEKEKLFNASKK